MEEWEIAFVEEHNLHPNILNDIEMGICPRELGNKLAVFSYELRNAYFVESYIVSKVQTAYNKSKSLKNVQDKIAKIDDYRIVYRKKAEEWRQFLDKYALKKGYVYIFSNIYMPGLIKIGYTEKNDVSERKDELYYQGKPGVPYPFNIEFAKFTVCPDRSEKVIHERLWEYRVNENREFFKIKAKKARNILKQVITEIESILVNHFNKTFGG
jgi:hypothetical protein